MRTAYIFSEYSLFCLKENIVAHWMLFHSSGALMVCWSLWLIFVSDVSRKVKKWSEDSSADIK